MFFPNCPHRSQWSPGVYQKVSLSFAVSVASALTAAVNKNVSFSPGRYHRASYQISYSLICSKIRLINNNLLPNRRNLYLVMWHSGTLNLLQGPMCCSFRNAFLHTLIVTGTYLSYCCLPVRSKQSGSSPLTSGINKWTTVPDSSSLKSPSHAASYLAHVGMPI